MSYLRVRNWGEFQHYKDRRPTWIKVYVELVQPHSDYLKLSLPARGLLVGLWLLAAEYGNAIPNDPEFIANVLRTSREQCGEALDELLRTRWIQGTSTARRASGGVPQSKRKSKEKETPKAPLTGVPVDNRGLRLIGEG